MDLCVFLVQKVTGTVERCCKTSKEILKYDNKIKRFTNNLS